MHNVAAITYNGLCTFEFGIAVEVFALKRPELGVPWYSFKSIAAEGKRSRAIGGVTIEADAGLESLSDADTIILPGWRDHQERPPQALLDALVQAHTRGARLFSICSGAFILAAAGLLNGKQATTHWRYTEALKAAYPKIMVKPDVLYVEAGNIITSAGSAAGIDASLHIVRQDFGSRVANSVARRLVLPPHRDGGQAQYIAPSKPRTGKAMSEVIDWARRNLNQPLSVARMASKAAMSERTFQRRFKAETGAAPMAWLQRERLFLAQEWLETSNAPLAEIALSCGYPSLDTFRIAFKRTLGVAPASYKARFNQKSA